MTYALISTNETVKYISSWVKILNIYQPVYTVLGIRVAEVVETPFEVSRFLFWVDCDPSVVADLFYYDLQDYQIKQIPPPAPKPIDPSNNPDQTGAENF
jgi:hypothetical protein